MTGMDAQILCLWMDVMRVSSIRNAMLLEDLRDLVNRILGKTVTCECDIPLLREWSGNKANQGWNFRSWSNIATLWKL